MPNMAFVDKLRFHLLFLPFIAALGALALLYGCSQDQKSAQQSQPSRITLENLQTAYAKSLKHHAMYSTFARKAESERFKEVANLYRAVARSEEIHAVNHAQLMRAESVEPKEPAIDSVSVGTTTQTLKMALSSEEIEIESMYANLIRTAELEKFAQAAEQFEKIQAADARQSELLKEAQDKNARIAKVPYFVCTGCGYILTSDKTDECPNCHDKKEAFVKI